MQTALHTVSRMRIALGTFIAIEAQASSRERALRGIETAFDAVASVDRLMHPTRPGSDLAALAGAPRGTRVPVHPWTWEVLDLSRELGERSAGAFDPCLETAPGRLTDIDLSGRGFAVPHDRVHVDLGGIAKGFALDRAVDALRAAGCDGGLVNAGGDLAVFGLATHRIVRMSSDGTGAALELKDGALAARVDVGATRPTEHRGYYHGVDRGRTIAGSATVIAPSAAVADALTKCVLLADPGLGQNLLEAFGARALRQDLRTPGPAPDRSA
jgi:thiamine biosynthesis lipoprotein